MTKLILFKVNFNNYAIFSAISYILLTNSCCQAAQKKGIIRFPFGGPYMGLFVALAVPLELDDYSVFVSYNFEANYVLPTNETFDEFPPILERAGGIARKFVYQAFQEKFISHGYPGKDCLLRAICEASELELEKTCVLAEIVHIILTPSSTKSEGLKDYENAENYGKLHKHCKKYKKKCKFSVLNVISLIQNLVSSVN